MAGNNNQNGWPNSFGMGHGSPLSIVPEQQPSTSIQLEQLDRVAALSNTLKRNPKMELTKNDLLKFVTYFEGEIQARDVSIAVLKSEKLKQLVNMGRYKPALLSDPYVALLRDSIIDSSTSVPAISERDIAYAADQQLQALEQLASQQRRAHQHMVNILKDAEQKHKKVIQELEEEKCKHEHDTAQGDDITYGLEMERTRLRQELEVEKALRKKLEKEVKRQQELADEERGRQKQIVLLLLAERKKIIIKYIEERKRSEDLAQILSEEKSRIDSMAEGLEEESKKSLQMEAELEKQVHIYEDDKKSLKSALAAKESRCKELEMEVMRLRSECDALRLSANRRTDITETVSSPMTSSVAKAVQPTATVSSVPVSGPMTGIAQSVSACQVLRPQTSVKQAAAAINQNRVASGKTPAPQPPSFQALTQQTSSGSGVMTTASASSSQPPQMPPKKISSLMGRGVPPPIPPNKPIVAAKLNTVRTGVKAAAPVAGSSATGKESASGDSNTSPRAAAGIEMLGQELADFQQVFVTLATGSNNT